MSKYRPLWIWIKENGDDHICLSFNEIEKILGFAIDHSFLQYKKELTEYGYVVKKISLKEKKVIFQKNK